MSDGPGILFDVDGTLVDTNYFHTLAWYRAFADVGETVPMWRLHGLIGMGSDQLQEEILGEEREELKEGWTKHFEQLMGEVTALPGAADLVRAVKERGATVIYATSGEAELVEELRQVVGADEWVDGVVNSSEVENSKPAPDIFGLALERGGLRPERTVVLGDSVWDVKAAEALGLSCVCVLTGGFSRAELEKAGAAAVYDDCAAVLADLDSSPFGALLGGG